MFEKKKRKKKSRRRTLTREALRLWSLVVRKRSGGRCERCPDKASEAHHIIARGTAPTMGWFDLHNGVALCAKCHKFRGAHSTDFEEQAAFNVWVREHLKKRDIDYDVLRVKCRAKGKMSEFDLEVTCKLLKEELENA